MAVTLKQVEATPESYPAITMRRVLDQLIANNRHPAIPEGFDDWIWQRIEGHTAWRWTEREVVWIIEGPGDWTPPLAPALVTETEIWNGNAFAPSDLAPSPLGYALNESVYRITATVGGADVPDDVMAAATRFSNYCLEAVDLDNPSQWATSATRSWSSQGHDGQSKQDQVSFQRQATWVARALQNSGAADLLRKYRRAP